MSAEMGNKDSTGTSEAELLTRVEQLQIQLTEEQGMLLATVARSVASNTACVPRGSNDNGKSSGNLSEMPPMVLWQLLHALDPVMAQRWHYRDSRKILRSLAVLLQTGKRYSDWLKEQRDNEQAETSSVTAEVTRHGAVDSTNTLEDDAPDCLVLWVTCDALVLQQRLDARVNKMIERGLLHEVVELRSIARHLEHSRGGATDYTRGIFQSIGYKEFAPYLAHLDTKISCQVSQSLGTSDGRRLLRPSSDDAEGARLFITGLGAMKKATRQYARRQVAWLRNKMIPEVVRHQRLAGANGEHSDSRAYLFGVDSSNIAKFGENVCQPAISMVDAFLAGKEIPRLPSATSMNSRDLCETRVGNSELAHSDLATDPAKVFEMCPVCSLDEANPFMVRQVDWDAHRRGRTHRMALKARGLTSPRRRSDNEAAQAKRAARQARRQSKDS